MHYARAQRDYVINATADPASSAPMMTLNARSALSDRNTRCSTAPNASHGKQLGSATSTKIAAITAACTYVGPPLSLRNIAAALAQTNQDFGLIH